MRYRLPLKCKNSKCLLERKENSPETVDRVCLCGGVREEGRERLKADMYVSLNEMYLCELVHALKINKAKLEEAPRNKSLPSAPPPPHVAKLPEPHTHLPHHFLGTRGIMKEG